MEKELMTPGFSASGIVMCSRMKIPCMKEACESWVELTYGENKVARCSESWVPVLLIEIRTSIDKLTEKLTIKEEGKNK